MAEVEKPGNQEPVAEGENADAAEQPTVEDAEAYDDQ